MFCNNLRRVTVLSLWRSKDRKNRFVLMRMLINKHYIINIQVSPPKFDVIKSCHAEENQTYPTCALIQFIFGVGNIFLTSCDKFGA